MDPENNLSDVVLSFEKDLKKDIIRIWLPQWLELGLKKSTVEYACSVMWV